MLESSADHLLQKIVSDVEERLRNGELKPGDKLPSESELSRQYTVNRNLVRRAFRILELRGHIDATQGRGRFVRRPRMSARFRRRLATPIRTSNEMGAYQSKTLQLNLIKARAPIADVLSLKERESVVSVSRVFYYDEVPTVMAKQYIKHDRFPEFFEMFEENGGSVSTVYADCGIKEIERHYSILSARLPDGEESELMNVPAHVPLFVVDSWSTVGDEIFECAQMKLPSDRVQIDLSNEHSVSA